MRDFMNKVQSLFESTERTLYHGTLTEYLPDIEKHGLVPTVGSFVSDFYDPSGDEGYDAERDSLEPLVFAAQKSDLQRCVNAIGHRLREKNIPWTPENIIKYGAIIAIKDGDFYHRNHDTSRGAAWEDDHPVQVEPGDYYSMREQLPHYIVTGGRLRDLLRRNRIGGFYSPVPIKETVFRKWITLCEAPQQLYLRFGNIPENERSKIGAAPNWIAAQTHHSLEHEHGVSVYWTHFDDETHQWVLDDVGNHTSAAELVAQAAEGHRPIYIVTGTELDEQGIDGEPLLRDVKIISTVPSVRDIMIPGVHDGRELEKTVIFRGDVTMIYPDGTTQVILGDRMTADDLDHTVGNFSSLNGIEVTYEGSPALFFRSIDSSLPNNNLATEILSGLLGRQVNSLYGNSMIIKNPRKTVEYV